MGARITLISLFDNTSIDKINNLVNVLNIKTCKVPYGQEGIINREEVDTLPYHITLFSWDRDIEAKVIDIVETLQFSETTIAIYDISIKKRTDNSFVLYLAVKENRQLKEMQKYIYDKIPNEKYNQKKFSFHITIHIDKDYNKVVEMKEQLIVNFKPFEISFNKLGLFEIYPAKKIIEKNT